MKPRTFVQGFDTLTALLNGRSVTLSLRWKLPLLDILNITAY